MLPIAFFLLPSHSLTTLLPYDASLPLAEGTAGGRNILNFFRTAARVEGFPTNYFGFDNLGAGSTNPRVESNATQNSLNSYFARFNYSLLGKYLFTLTERADGASKFGTNNK